MGDIVENLGFAKAFAEYGAKPFIKKDWIGRVDSAI